MLSRLQEEATGSRVDTTDGVKVYFDDGWVLARPSGTEPIFRIFSEAGSEERAVEIAESYKTKVNDIIG